MMMKVRSLAALSLALFGGFLATSPLHAQAPSLTVADPSCVPGECVCSGALDDARLLAETGLRAAELSAGLPCLAADFDGNGYVDFAIPGAEGMAAAVMTGEEGVARAFRLEALGMLELYEPRDSAGPNGELPSETYGLFVAWVGQHHAIFLWDGETLGRTLLPAW